MRRSVRWLSALLCVVMVIGMLPMTSLTVSATSTEKFANSQLDIATEKTSTLAPGITQDAYTVYDSNGDQVKMFITTADMSVDTVKLFASYKDMDPTNYGMSKLTEQVEAFNEKAAAGDEYYQGTVVAGINASYYNMTTGKPTGTFVMNGIDVTTESEGNAYGYFAVMKDGSVKIGNKGDYSADKGNIQEAIGIYTMLIVDGQIVSGLNSTTKYPRQTIGITADGDVILMTADGNQAPKSVGLTVQEQAQVMLDLGCVWAGHLDGGGSCTYASKPEGSDEFVITNSPSDGSERSVSNGFIIVSTAAASYSFDHVVYDVENAYVTPGTSVTVGTTGVSSTGNSADIPEGLTYEVVNGTYADGVFTAGTAVGDATITAMYNGEAVGSTTINVVVPDALTFQSSTITVPYGKTVPLNLVANYGVNKVAFKASDISFTLSDSAIGSISDMSFTACAENEAVTGGTVTATLAADTSVACSATITLGKGSEVLQDYESGVLPSDYYIITGYPQYGPSGANGQNELGELYMVTAENGKVHDGQYALAVECDFSQAYETGYHQLQLRNLALSVPAKAQTIGMWLYLPELEELYTTSMRFVGTRADTDATVASPWLWDNCEPYGWENDGWRYVSMDISGYDADITFNTLQIYICDRDNSSVDFTFSEHASVNGKFTYYIDSITIDYSSAVDDREPPVFTDVLYADTSMSDSVSLSGQTVSNSTVSFTAQVAEDTTKTNYTGLDTNALKAFIDGVAVEAAYTDGMITIEGAVLADGVHTVRFEASDMMGNMAYVERQINVQAGSDLPTISIVPQDPDADKILIGSLYWVDLVATDAQSVETATVTFDLNSVSQWELDHMVVTSGFKAEYTIDEVSNNATITVTKVGKVAEDATVLVQIPIRTWESRLTEYAGYEDQTPEKLWSRKIIWPMDIKLSANYGAVTFADGTTGTFSMEKLAVITELYGNYSELNANGDYSNKTSWHIHTAEAMEDKAATCTEDGYTGRTYCAECESVVDWGTTIPATGHSYAVTDGVLECACGDLFSGVHTDGKTYVDGVVIADGWSGESYYVDGVKLTGLQEIDGYYYDFGTEGVCPNKAKVDGFFYDESISAYRYFTAGLLTTGEVSIYPEVYFYDANGVAVSGEVDVLGYTCWFDEKGAFVSSDDASVVDAGFSGTNIQYVLLSSGLLKVDGEGVMKDYQSSGLYPAWVTQNDATTITALEVGNGITKIGRFGFYKNVYLRTVTFEEGSSLETISWGAFGHNWRLTGIEIPASVKVLEGYALYECGAMTSVTFEEGSQLQSIGNAAFYRARTLQTIYIPESVVTMEADIFDQANADAVLQVAENSVGHLYAQQYGLNVELRPGTVKVVKSGELSSTVSWTMYSDGVLEISGTGAMPNFASHSEQPWYSSNGQIKKIVIGKDITSVGNYAFCYAQNVTEIEFQEGSQLEKVGVLSFHNLPKITNVVLSETVTSISAYGFGDCFGLESLYIPQSTSYIYKTAFTGSANVVLNVAAGTYAEDFAKQYGIAYETREFVYEPIASGDCGENVQWAMYENGELWITGSGAMINYSSHKDQPWYTTNHKIKKIVIGKDITSLGNYAFCYAQNVTEIEFQEGSQLERVGILSFHNLPSLTSVVLPETVTYIGAYGFGDCFGLESLYIPQSTSYIYKTAFNGSTKVVLNVSAGTYAEDYAKQYGIAYETREFVYEPIASGDCGENVQWAMYENGELWITGSGAMVNYTSHNDQPWYTTNHKIKRIVIGKDITAIGNYAFCYAQNVTEIVFEEGSQLQSVGVLSFMNLPSVTSVVLPETVTSISAYAFGDCYGLTELYIPAGVSFIYKTAFDGSANVVLNVAAGSYAEQFAQDKGIAYTVR